MHEHTSESLSLLQIMAVDLAHSGVCSDEDIALKGMSAEVANQGVQASPTAYVVPAGKGGGSDPGGVDIAPTAYRLPIL